MDVYVKNGEYVIALDENESLKVIDSKNKVVYDEDETYEKLELKKIENKNNNKLDLLLACELFFKQYKKVYKIFRNYLEEYKKVNGRISYDQIYTHIWCEKNLKTGNKIYFKINLGYNLEYKTEGKLRFEGVTFEIPFKDVKVFKYLYSSIFANFIEHHKKTTGTMNKMNDCCIFGVIASDEITEKILLNNFDGLELVAEQISNNIRTRVLSELPVIDILKIYKDNLEKANLSVDFKKYDKIQMENEEICNYLLKSAVVKAPEGLNALAECQKFLKQYYEVKEIYKNYILEHKEEKECAYPTITTLVKKESKNELNEGIDSGFCRQLITFEVYLENYNIEGISFKLNSFYQDYEKLSNFILINLFYDILKSENDYQFETNSFDKFEVLEKETKPFYHNILKIYDKECSFNKEAKKIFFKVASYVRQGKKLEEILECIQGSSENIYCDLDESYDLNFKDTNEKNYQKILELNK